MPGGVLGTKGLHQLQTMAMPARLVGHHLGAAAAPNTHSFILQEGNVLGCPTTCRVVTVVCLPTLSKVSNSYLAITRQERVDMPEHILCMLCIDS